MLNHREGEPEVRLSNKILSVVCFILVALWLADALCGFPIR